MADQTSRGFRKFMLDPKSSVMTYIADNIPSDHLSHQQGSNGRLQNGPMNGQQSNVQDPNRLQQNQALDSNTQGQSQDSFMRPHSPHRPGGLNSQSSSPRPGYAQPVQSTQLPVNVPYIASNLGQGHQGLDGYAGGQSQLPSSQSVPIVSMAQDSRPQQNPQSHVSQATATLGQGPPQPGARRRNSPQSAPRLYHRMVLQFEITKKAFFVAKSQRNIQEMTSSAYELESSSRRIWGLRYEHSWEFEGYSEAGHQAVLSKWQAEYEMWADTVLDIQDGQVLADAANPSEHGNASIHKDAEEWNPQSTQDQSQYHGLHGETHQQSQPMQQVQMHSQLPQQMPPQQQMSPPQQMPLQHQFSPLQQMPQLQNLSMGQSAPPPQSMQSNQSPQPMLPGSFPQNGPPSTVIDQSMPPQQHQQNPQPHHIPVAQSPPPNMQNGQNLQPGQFNGAPNMQSIPNFSSPNMPQPQNMRPGQAPNMQQGQNRPPQQYVQQNQGMPTGSGPNTQQLQNAAAGQQGPPRNSMSPSQNMGPRQSPSPHGGSQIPPSLLAGGQMQGNGRL